ncbi:MAG: STAS domain-containing protein [Phycisphaerales bacterium]|nr:STAS domain-containing protein [Phycisphaerales bacterium]
MEIAEQRQGAVTVLKPQGPLCGPDAEQFLHRINEVMGRSLGRFVVDCAAIAWVDSRGLEVLKETTEQLSSGGQALRLCGCNETVREVLEMTDLSTRFEHYQDVGTAVRSFL